jgi:hypothetical protein
LEVLVAGDACSAGEGAVVRRGQLIVVVVVFLIGCALLLAVGCSGTSSEPSKKEQGHTEATKQEQGRSPQATSSEEARCQGTRTITVRPAPKEVSSGDSRVVFTTYDLRSCPKGGLLIGTDKPDKLAGRDGDDEIRGFGAKDDLLGGLGNDVIYGGSGSDVLADWPLPGLGLDTRTPSGLRIFRKEWAKAGGDDVLYGGDGRDILEADKGEDVLYGGDGDDLVLSDSLGAVDEGGPRDKLYCGKGKDTYKAAKNDYVDSSCEHEGFPRFFGERTF